MRNMNQRPNCDACSSQYNEPLRGMPLAMAYVHGRHGAKPMIRKKD